MRSNSLQGPRIIPRINFFFLFHCSEIPERKLEVITKEGESEQAAKRQQLWVTESYKFKLESEQEQREQWFAGTAGQQEQQQTESKLCLWFIWQQQFFGAEVRDAGQRNQRSFDAASSVLSARQRHTSSSF